MIRQKIIGKTVAGASCKNGELVIRFADGSRIKASGLERKGRRPAIVCKYIQKSEGDNQTFQPDWASKPGDTIYDVMLEKDITPDELAEGLGYEFEFIDKLTSGKAVITERVAKRLAKVLGGTTSFWLNRERIYRETLERLARIKE